MAIPPENHVLDHPAGPHAPRTKDRYTLSAHPAHAVVSDAIGALTAHLDAELLGRRIIGPRVHVGKIILPPANVVEVRTLDRRVDQLEVEILPHGVRRTQERSAMMPHFGDRCRLVSRRVEHPETFTRKVRRPEACTLQRRVSERSHDIPGAGAVCAIRWRNPERGLNSLAQQRIGARAERDQRLEIVWMRHFLEQLHGRKNRRYEPYRSLPREPLWLETRRFAGGFGQPPSPGQPPGARMSGRVRPYRSALAREVRGLRRAMMCSRSTPTFHGFPCCGEKGRGSSGRCREGRKADRADPC